MYVDSALCGPPVVLQEDLRSDARKCRALEKLTAQLKLQLVTETPVPRRQGGSPPLSSERISAGRYVSQLGVGGVPCGASAPPARLATASPVAATPTTQAERCAPPQLDTSHLPAAHDFMYLRQHYL